MKRYLNLAFIAVAMIYETTVMTFDRAKRRLTSTSLVTLTSQVLYFFNGGMILVGFNVARVVGQGSQ